MKRKFEELRENLDEFVTQNDYPVLVVGCLPEELAYVAKFLQALDEKHPESFFVMFGQPFSEPVSYVNSLVEGLRVQLQAAGEARAQRGEPPFPPMPRDLADARRSPQSRLFALHDYLRQLLPNERDYRVVVGLLPLQCANMAAFAKVVAVLLPPKEFPPWMQALRVVVYDDRAQKHIAADLSARKVERVLSFDVDFSTPALTDALVADAADPSLPAAERMANLTQLAALDYSYKRYPEAIEKYGILYKYYEVAGVPAMQALCLVGAGDTLRASGQVPAAKEMLQRAIAFSLEHKALAILLNGLMSIVEVCFDLGHFADAEGYADSGTQVAAGVLNPYAYADLFERRGDAQMAQKKSAEALVSYERCRALCRMYQHVHRWESVLPKLPPLCKQQGKESEQREAERELEQVLAGQPPKPLPIPSPPPAAGGEVRPS